MDKKTLVENESKVAQLFSNSKKNNRLANAYLLYGPRNAPLKETAFFLAKSINCEKDYLACDDCPSCKRFNEGVRPDFIFIDGSLETIQKEDVKDLESKFSLSALEKNHKLVYVIHQIENITDKASNALLKFLEEPKEGQIAFLTTNNLMKVLPTIRSRSIEVRIDPIDPDGFYKSLLAVPFETADSKKPRNLSEGEAYILSRLFSDVEEVKRVLLEDDSFIVGYQSAEAFLNDLATSFRTASFTLLRQNSLIKDSKCYNWLYLTIDNVFASILVNDISDINPFKEIIRPLIKKKANIERGEAVIKKALAMKQLNLSPTLISAELITALE